MQTLYDSLLWGEQKGGGYICEMLPQELNLNLHLLIFDRFTDTTQT